MAPMAAAPSHREFGKTVALKTVTSGRTPTAGPDAGRTATRDHPTTFSSNKTFSMGC